MGAPPTALLEGHAEPGVVGREVLQGVLVGAVQQAGGAVALALVVPREDHVALGWARGGAKGGASEPRGNADPTKRSLVPYTSARQARTLLAVTFCIQFM